jgi:hypothetical protein
MSTKNIQKPKKYFGGWSLFGVWVLGLMLVLPGGPFGDKVDGLVLPGCVCQAAIRTKTF